MSASSDPRAIPPAALLEHAAFVRRVAFAVLNHRLILSYRARLDGIRTQQIVDDVLGGVDETGIRLPDDVVVAGRASV